MADKDYKIHMNEAKIKTVSHSTIIYVYLLQKYRKVVLEIQGLNLINEK